jgi:NADH-quinone oxidoreductase subunit L
LSYNKWYFDEIYEASVIWGTTAFAKVLALFDLYIIDGIVNLVGWFTKVVGHFIGLFDLYVIDGLVNLTANITAFFGIVLRKFQTGRIQAYIVMTIIFAMVLLYYVL